MVEKKRQKINICKKICLGNCGGAGKKNSWKMVIKERNILTSYLSNRNNSLVLYIMEIFFCFSVLLCEFSHGQLSFLFLFFCFVFPFLSLIPSITEFALHPPAT